MNNLTFMRNGKEFEPTKNELKIVLDDYAKRNNDLEEELEAVKKQLTIMDKALELACRELMPYRPNMCGGLYTTYELEDKIQNFKQKAKEMLKDE